MNNSYYRIEVPGAMVYWLGISPSVKRYPIESAITRVRARMSSIWSNSARAQIDPKHTDNVKRFLSASHDQFIVKEYSHPESINSRAHLTRELNQQELFISAGKICVPQTKAAYDALIFRAKYELPIPLGVLKK